MTRLGLPRGTVAFSSLNLDARLDAGCKSAKKEKNTEEIKRKSSGVFQKGKKKNIARYNFTFFYFFSYFTFFFVIIIFSCKKICCFGFSSCFCEKKKNVGIVFPFKLAVALAISTIKLAVFGPLRTLY